MTGFKIYKEKTRFDFGRLVLIGGENHVGKTTVGEAIVFAIYGINMRGETKRSEEFINNESEVAIVELGFTDDMGGKHRITRIKDFRSGSVQLDDKKNTTQKEITHIFGEPKFFLSCFSAFYFNNYMEDDKLRRDLLGRFAPVIDYARLFGEMADASLISKYSINLSDRKEQSRFSKLRDAVSEEITNARREIQFLYAQNAEDKDQPQSQKPVYEAKEAEVKARIERLRAAEKANISLHAQLERYEEQLKQVEANESATARLREEIAQRYPNYISGKLQENPEYQKLLDARNKCAKLAPPRQMDISQLTECPTCGMLLSDEHKEGVSKKQQEELLAIEKHNKLVDEKLSKIKSAMFEMEQSEREALLLMSKIQMLVQNSIRPEKPKGELVNTSELADLEAKYTKIVEYNRATVQFNKNVFDSQLRRQKRAQTIAQLEQKVLSLEAELDEYTKVWRALSPATGIHRKAMEERAKSIQSDLVHCRIVLERPQKDGGIDECFEIYYKDRPYRLCSTSEQMLASMEIARFLRNRSSKNIPLFLDQAESITSIPDIYRKDLEQIFLCSVIKGQKEMKVVSK